MRSCRRFRFRTRIEYSILTSTLDILHHFITQRLFLEGVAEGLVQSGAHINAPGSRFRGTVLDGATLREHTGIMEMLLKAGANPSQADYNLVAPLHTAARVGNPKVMKLLLDYGASNKRRIVLVRRRTIGL